MGKEQKARIKVYAIEGCPYCRATRELLDELSIAYELEDLTDHPDRRSVTESLLPGHRSVPLILIDGEPMGGNSELQAMHAEGKLLPKVFGQAWAGRRGRMRLPGNSGAPGSSLSPGERSYR